MKCRVVASNRRGPLFVFVVKARNWYEALQLAKREWSFVLRHSDTMRVEEVR